MDLSMNINLLTYKEIKNDIQSFDAIFFRGGDLISDMIEVLEKYKVSSGVFTHVGMVVTADILPYCNVKGLPYHLESNKLYILESTFGYEIPHILEGKCDITTGKGKFGVQLRELEDIIPWYITNDKTKVA